MSHRNTGGSAFPIHVRSEMTIVGMSLRDYFAAKSLQGFLGDPNVPLENDKLAEWAYKLADAMLKAREQ